MATAKQLLVEAASLEAHAKDSLTAWSILGQTDKYADHMQKAANLRRAAELKGIERSQFMQLKGIS